jgi:hypothetical protein
MKTICREITEKQYLSMDQSRFHARDAVAFTSGGGLSASGSVQCLNIITNDNSYSGRTGRVVDLKTLRVWGMVYPLAAGGASLTQQFLRFLVFYDRQANGTTPTASDLLQSAGVATAVHSLVGLNINNQDRFLMLSDDFIVPCTYNTPIDTNPTDCTRPFMSFEHYYDLCGLQEVFKADSQPGVIADIATGSLWFMALSNVNTPATWEYQLSSRLRFLG